MPNDTNRMSFTYDGSTVLKDDGLVAASGRLTVGGKAKWIDVGNSEYRGYLVNDVNAIETDSSNELYRLILQGAQRDTTWTPDNPVPQAGTLETLLVYEFGHTAVRGGGSITTTPGRYITGMFRNVMNDVTYPVIGLYMVVAGTVTSGINFRTFIGKGSY